MLSSKASILATLALASSGMATVAAAADSCQVEYVLFNADTDVPLGLLEEQLQPSPSSGSSDSSYYCIPDYKVNIQARPTASCSVTESAFMTLDGPIKTSREENVGPYTIFGDNPSTGDIFGRDLKPGHYTIDSDIYEKDNLKGELVVRGALDFEAKFCGCEIEYILFDADKDVAVGELKENECVRPNEFNIQARPTPACPVTESAGMTLDGPIHAQRLENLGPYTIFGDRSGDIFGRDYQEGVYTIHSEIFSEDDLRGYLVVERDFHFTVSKDCKRRLRANRA